LSFQSQQQEQPQQQQQQQQDDAGSFHNHVKNFFASDVRSRSQPRPSEKLDRRADPDDDRRQRATTPGRTLLGEISNLKPVAQRKSVIAAETESKACDFTKHFKVTFFLIFGSALFRERLPLFRQKEWFVFRKQS
jgi:hypothetical protein